VPQQLKDLAVPITSVVAVIGALFAGASWIQTSIKEVAREVAVLRHDVNGLESKVAVMDGNRFTSADGLAIWQAIASAKSDIVRLETRQVAIAERMVALEKK
jgi:hypothetical protein